MLGLRLFNNTASTMTLETLTPAPTLDIARLSHEGRGVGRNEAGKTVFIDGVLPGEKVTYSIKAKKRRFDEAQLLEVLEPAAERVDPPCAHFLICGGCSQQHVSHAAQLAAKQQSLLEQLAHFGQVQAQEIMPALTGPQLGYRTKARLGVRFVQKKGKVLVGFREKNSNFLADIDSCLVLHPKIGLLIEDLKIFIAQLDGYRTIAQIEVAIGDGQLALVIRNLEALTAKDLQAWIEFAQAKEFAFYTQAGGLDTVTKVCPADQLERLYYSLPAHNLNMAFHPMDFTQVNPALNQKMLQQALSLLQLTSEDQVLDLFCGLGNFTLPMAQQAGRVIGVEGSEAMVQRGYENAQRNGISNVEFYAADLTADHTNTNWAQQKYTKILLDPPRSGAAEVLPLIAKLGVDTILYVSCNPATLARDCGILVNDFGYNLAKVGIMDMFPHTLHVEAMALFVKGRNGKGKRVTAAT